MIQNKSILVVGAGPVGLAAAIELARRGAKPRIIDSNSCPNPHSRALAVNSRSLDLLGPCGAAGRLIAAGIKIHKLLIRRNGKVLSRLDLAAIPHKYNFLLSVAQHDTEVILCQTLALFGISVERNLGLQSLGNGTATLTSGEKLNPDTIIGADGAHSVVRKSLSIGFPGAPEERTFGLADVYLEDWPFDFETVVVTLLDTHIAPFVPMGPNFGRMISTKGDCLNSLPPDAKVKSVEWETDFKISYRHAETYQKGNCFIAGDAAHIHSPVGGRGMNLGIEDACWLAYLLSEGREAEYTKLRWQVVEDTLRFTHNFTRLATMKAWQRNVLLSALLPLITRLPGFRSRVFAMLSALDTPPPEWL